MDDANYFRRPDVSIGFALVDHRNGPFPSTVSDSARGAMINALVSIWNAPVFSHHTDAAIEAMFNQKAPSGFRISVVAIEAVEVID